MQVVVICVCKLNIKSATHEQMSEELPEDVLSGVKLINSNTIVLDPSNVSVTLQTLERAAFALGKKLHLELT